MFPRPHQLGGQSGRASRPLERCRRTRQRRRHHRPTVLLPLLRQRRGKPERSRQQLGPMAKSAARGGRPPTPLIPVPCARWRSTTTAAVEHGSCSGSSSNDNTNDHDSWWDITCVEALLQPFDPGKRCWRSTRRGKAVLGVDLPFDRGKAWRVTGFVLRVSSWFLFGLFRERLENRV